jgi:myo-inositol catabolism protein IolC
MYLVPLDRQAPWPAAALMAAKHAVYEGVAKAASDVGLPAGEAGIIVDEHSGASILREATGAGFQTACAIKTVDDPGFAGDEMADAAHLDSCRAPYWRVVLRYNPEGDRAANFRQAAWTRRLSDALRRRGGPRLMCDLVVAPTQWQIALGIRAYERDVLPLLTRRAITQLLEAGVEPDVWVTEGFARRDEYVRVLEAITSKGRSSRCLVRAAGHANETTRELMTVGLSVPGVDGVVLGRAPFWEPAASWICGRSSRAVAVSAVASEFLAWISQLEAAI